MRKTLVLLVGCLLLSGSVLFAETRPEARQASVEREARDGSGPVKLPAGERAFFSLADHWVPPGARELKIEIRLAGKSVLQDVLQLPEDAADGTFELLAGDPAGLERVLKLAKKMGDRAQVVVSLDGQVLRSFSIPEFLEYNERFRETPPEVRSLLGEVRTFAPAVAEAAGSREDPGQPTALGWDPNCIAACDADRDYCYQTEPSCFGVDWCEVCENQWSACHNGCWICEDPKSVSQYTSSWIKNAYWAGTACLSDVFQNKNWYDFYNLTIQNDRYQRTEYCNGSVAHTLLYSWDTYGSCTRNTPWTCSSSTGSAFGPYCPF